MHDLLLLILQVFLMSFGSKSTGKREYLTVQRPDGRRGSQKYNQGFQNQYDVRILVVCPFDSPKQSVARRTQESANQSSFVTVIGGKPFA